MRTIKKSLLCLLAIVGMVISSCSSNAPVVSPTATTIAPSTILPTATFTLTPEPTHTPTITPTHTPIPTISKTRINLSSELYLDESSSPDNLRGEPYDQDRFCFQQRNGIGCVYHLGNEEWVGVQTWTHIVPFADFDATPQSGEGLRQDYFQIWKDGEMLYSSPTDTMWYQPHKVFRYEDHWIFSFMDDARNQGRIVQDGTLLNDLHDYDNAFSLFLLDGKPFFFFKRGDQFGISFNNQEISLPYPNISYDVVCCEGGGRGRLNPRGTDIMVGFWVWWGNNQYQYNEYRYIEIGLR